MLRIEQTFWEMSLLVMSAYVLKLKLILNYLSYEQFKAEILIFIYLWLKCADRVTSYKIQFQLVRGTAHRFIRTDCE